MNDFSFTQIIKAKNIWFAPLETPTTINTTGYNEEPNSQIEHIYIPNAFKSAYSMFAAEIFKSRITYYDMADLEEYHYSFQSTNGNIYYVEDDTKDIDTLESYISEMTEANFTFINGPPGTGKTLLNVSLTLTSEENFIEELEKNLLDYEPNYKYLNFAKVRQNPEKFPEHKDYITYYGLLNNRKSLNISNYAIFSPLLRISLKSLILNNMRVNIPTDSYPLEEYITISISEFDKEYNSHDNKKEVGEDGVATFFSTISHNLKRHVKIFVDYQLKDQVPLRIRGNAEFFIII